MYVDCHIVPDCEKEYASLCIRKMTPAIAEAVALLKEYPTDSGAIPAHREGRIYFLQPADIELVRTEGRNVVCCDLRGQKYVLREPLYRIEQLLPSGFVRISKSAIVNVRGINHVEASFSGTMRLVTRSGIHDTISRSFRRSFRKGVGLE